jgi:colanic acid/amylovoran biosynthesis glycosyltransferase
MKIGYIFSMKKGIAPFIYNELLHLEKNNIRFTIFPTRSGSGMDSPKPEWQVVQYNPLGVLLTQPFQLLKHPFIYLKLFGISVKTGTIIHFFIACYLKKFMKDLDLIHCHFGDDKLFIGYYCKKWLHCKLSVTIHAHELYRNNFRLFSKALDSCDKVITISDFNKNILLSKFAVEPSKIHVNRMFVEADDYKYEEKFKILIVAFFHKKKGHQYLFQAVKQLQDIPNIEIWVAGDMIPGYAEENLQKLVSNSGIEDKICFFGLQKGASLKALINECDVFCLPSVKIKNDESEGIPVSLMEAMSFSKPVISTRHAGIPELVPAELVDEGDVEGLCMAIRRLYHDKELRKTQGETNRNIILNNYSPGNSKSLISLFAGIIEPKIARV